MKNWTSKSFLWTEIKMSAFVLDYWFWRPRIWLQSMISERKYPIQHSPSHGTWNYRRIFWRPVLVSHTLVNWSSPTTLLCFVIFDGWFICEPTHKLLTRVLKTLDPSTEYCTWLHSMLKTSVSIWRSFMYSAAPFIFICIQNCSTERWLGPCSLTAKYTLLSTSAAELSISEVVIDFRCYECF